MSEEEKEYRMVKDGIVVKLIVDEDPFPQDKWDYITGVPLEWWNTNIIWLKEVKEDENE